ncbi:MAG: alanine--tRNA ligase [Candidatus Wildermuthbacteria bacterium]|nr:alanine--tRNA ligase [Candidatus Wildermuthbacteria bacterium]
MTIEEIRTKYLAFFESKGHKIISSASLVPDQDPTTLFTGSGMQPMIRYLLGQPHPMGKRIADSQKCFRADDIDEVGDNRHTTFFEMLGNWSLGDYFKEEQLPWIFEFLTNELKLDPKKVYVTVFAGDEKNRIPKDTQSAGIWKKLFAEKGIDAKDIEIGTEENGAKTGMQGGRIFYYGAKKNWWSRAGAPENMPAGEPGGPDSEMFYEFADIEHNKEFGEHCHPNCDCGRFLEIANSVFMEYRKKEDGGFEKLSQQNVDFGGGLERMAAAVNDSADVFTADTLALIIADMEKLSGNSYAEFQKEFRVVADHLRGAVFMIGDAVTPSNTERGYFTRRLLRRAVRYADAIGLPAGKLAQLAKRVIMSYGQAYPELARNADFIQSAIGQEEERFRKTLEKGLGELKKIATANARGAFGFSGDALFDLYQTYGFPMELSIEIVANLYKEQGNTAGIPEDVRKEFAKAFTAQMKKHQELSRTAAAGRFKGGLADASVETTRLHTAHHLLLAALRSVLGDHVHQRGSNITAERLRIDFAHSQKVTPEELQKIEALVKEKIAENLDMVRLELPLKEAMVMGAEMEFGVKYGDMVSVYVAKDKQGNIFSKEFCGGPHAKGTGELGAFKILKEEAVASGVRRIRAVLGDNK